MEKTGSFKKVLSLAKGLKIQVNSIEKKVSKKEILSNYNNKIIKHSNEVYKTNDMTNASNLNKQKKINSSNKKENTKSKIFETSNSKSKSKSKYKVLNTDEGNITSKNNTNNNPNANPNLKYENKNTSKNYINNIEMLGSSPKNNIATFKTDINKYKIAVKNLHNNNFNENIIQNVNYTNNKGKTNDSVSNYDNYMKRNNTITYTDDKHQKLSKNLSIKGKRRLFFLYRLYIIPLPKIFKK